MCTQQSQAQFKCGTLAYKLEYPQLLLNHDSIIPKIITDKVMGIFQIWFPTLLESFLTIHIG